MMPGTHTAPPASKGFPRSQSSLSAGLYRATSSFYNFFRLRNSPSHQRTVKSASRILTMIRSFQGDTSGARVFTYLRKVDPNVFEEMILTALQDGGRIVRRNLRYSGDGGEDGRFYEPGTGWLLVQCKRYGTHISAEHVREFGRLVRSSGCVGGIFVHTGRTGAAAWVPASGATSRVVMVSGNGLLSLLRQGKLP